MTTAGIRSRLKRQYPNFEIAGLGLSKFESEGVIYPNSYPDNAGEKYRDNRQYNDQ